MSSPSSFNCFGLVIHGMGWLEVCERVTEAIHANRQLWIVTANPEILLEAKRDPSYWNVLRQADLRLVDGIGLAMVGHTTRIAGVDLAEQLLGLAQTQRWKIGLIGGREAGIAEKAARAMRQKYQGVQIVSEHGGTISNEGRGDAETEEALHRLTLEAPEILFVAFGHPKQEQWIAQHIASLPSVKIVIGVGGTVDYWAGTIKRAPRWMRRIGLEWLWRLFVEPTRWKRIWRAVVVFPLIVLFDRSRSN